jgi:hypothetical protein
VTGPLTLALRTQSSGPGAAWIVGGILVMLLVGAFIQTRLEQRRREAVQKALRDLGLSSDRAVSTLYAALLAPIERLAQQRADSVEWAAQGVVNGVELIALEHEYTTGSGKSKSTHRHAVVSIPVPEAWPALTITAENFFHKIGDLFGSRDIRVEDDQFNRRYRIKSDSEDFAILFLAPAVQQEMLTWDRSLCVAVRAGRLCVYRSGHPKQAGWTGLIDAATSLRRALAPELEAWTA